MCHVGLLRFAYVPQQRSRGRHRLRRVTEPRLVHRAEPELLAHARGAGHVFVVVAAHFQQAAELFLREIGYGLRLRRALVHDKLARGKPPELV